MLPEAATCSHILMMPQKLRLKETNMKSKIKTIIFVVLGIMLSYYMSNIFTQILSPKLQFFVDASKYCEDNSLQIFRYDKEGEDVKSADGINYNYETTYGEKRIKLKFQFLNNNVIDCHINDYKNDNIKNISKYTTVAGYSNVFCIITDIVDAKHNIIWCFLFIVFLVGELYVALKIIKRKCDPYWLIYSKTSLDYIGIKPIVFSFIITVGSLLIYYGCDLQVISESIIMWQKGIDIYQLFASLNKYKGISLYMWQYDGAMLAGYGLPNLFLTPFLHFFHPENYHWMQAFVYKMFNMLLCNLTVLSIISYFIDCKKITKKKAKEVYFWSIFNPITFYVAIIFIQFDMLPVYCITLGVLLFRKNESKYVVMSAIMIAYGIATKMTSWMFIPFIAFFVVWIICKTRNLKNMSIFIIVSGLFLSILCILPRLLDTPIKRAFTKLPQSERIWFTTLAYVDSAVYVYLAIAALVFIFIINICKVNLNWKLEEVIEYILIMMGVVTLIFSGITLSTPSFYLNTLPAFALMYLYCNDNFERLIKAMFAILIGTSYLFLPEGDITASLYFFGKQPIFTAVANYMNEHGAMVKWQSTLFTISVATMLAYAYIFGKMAWEKNQTQNYQHIEEN